MKFLGGIMSFSMTFYVLMFFYFGVLSVQRRNRIKSKKFIYLFLIVVLCLLFLCCMPKFIMFFNEVVINKAIRFILGKQGGNNRISSHYWEYFIEMLVMQNKLIFGLGYGAKLLPEFSSASYIGDLVIEYGIIGTFFYSIIPILLFGLNYRNGEKNWLFLIAFYLSMYQRPQIFNLPYILILLGASKNVWCIGNLNTKVPIKGR